MKKNRILTAAIILISISLLLLVSPYAAAQYENSNLITEINKYLRQNKLSKAEYLAQQWVNIKPYPLSWYTLGMILFREHKYMQAYDILLKALPSTYVQTLQSAKIYYMLGVIDLEFKNYDKAIARFYDGLHIKGIPKNLKSMMEAKNEEALREKEFTFWKKEETPHIIFYYPVNKRTKKIIPQYEKTYNKYFDLFEREFKISQKPKIKFYYYDKASYFNKLNPDIGRPYIYLREQGLHGWQNGHLAHLFFNLLVYRINHRNYPSYLISEGFAQYALLKEKGENIHHKAAVFIQLRGVPPIKDVDTSVTFNRTVWANNLAASFVGWLNEKYGKEKFISFWKSAKGFEKDANIFFGKKIGGLWEDWANFLQDQTISEEEYYSPFTKYILPAGLWKEGLLYLKKHPSNGQLYLVLKSRCLLGLGNYKAALNEILKLGNLHDNYGKNLSTFWKGRALLLEGKLLDILGKRREALSFYKKIQNEKNIANEIKIESKKFIKSPCTKFYLEKESRTDVVTRNKNLTLFLLKTGLSTNTLVFNITKKLDNEKIKELFKNINIRNYKKIEFLKKKNLIQSSMIKGRNKQEKLLKTVDTIKDVTQIRLFLRRHLSQLAPEVALQMIRNAGISIIDIGQSLM